MFGRICRAAAARLPGRLQFELRRANYYWQIRHATFASPEIESREIARHLREGDWAIDVGANVGHYTCEMARCVGASGRVLAFEPIPTSFALLTANVRAAGYVNVSLFNLALSDKPGVACMTVPTYEDSKLADYYRAHLSQQGEFPVLCMALDKMSILGRVSLVKIDAEGHDLQVLMGMQSLLQRDRPTLIVEGWQGGAIAKWLQRRAYEIHATADSANIVARPVR